MFFIVLILILIINIGYFFLEEGTIIRGINGGEVHKRFKSIDLEVFPNNEIITLKKHKNKKINHSYDLLKSWFPEGVNKEKIQVVKETVYSLSRKDSTDFLKTYISKHFTDTNNLIITDSSANVGGNSISFCEYFKFVNSVEIDNKTSKALENNLNLYNRNNFKIYNNDYLEIQNKLVQDIVFFDPPWGGLNMNKKDKIDIKLGEMSLNDIILNFKILPTGIIIKVPNNYLYDPLKKNNNYEIFIYPYYNQLFIIMTKKQD